MNFEFFVIVQDDVVFKVGSLYFVDSCSFPFIITRLFKLSLSGSVFVSGVRFVIEGGGGKLFHSWIIFNSLLNAYLFILVAVRSLVCQMCLVKSLIMFFVVILVSVCVKKGILE